MHTFWSFIHSKLDWNAGVMNIENNFSYENAWSGICKEWMKCLIDCRLLVPAKDCLCCVKRRRPTIESPSGGQQPTGQVTNGDVRMAALGIRCTTPMPSTDDELNAKFNELVVGHDDNYFPVFHRLHHQLKTLCKLLHKCFPVSLLHKLHYKIVTVNHELGPRLKSEWL